MNGRRTSLAALILVLVFNVWFRCHTIGPTIRDRTGLRLYPVLIGEAEPLDCDESIYAYIGARITTGSVMYRDLTENKPPGGYWLYAMAVALGGLNETTIRLMPVPFVLGTIVLAWWIAGKVAGPVAAVSSAFIYGLMSTDPYLYGNGANMEHFLNLFSTSGLALVVGSWSKRSRRGLFAAGVCVGAACLVKQVAGLPLFVYLMALGFSQGDEPRAVREKILDMAMLVAGFVAICLGAALVLFFQGAGAAAYDDIFRYGRALATDTPGDPKEKSFFLRWFTGNTDPEGRLPWPFGTTKGRAWWASGSWPLWAASVPAMIWIAIGPQAAARRLVAAWTVASWVQVAAPGLFWQHYYLLPLPGVAASVGISLADAIAASRSALVGRRWVRLGFSGTAALVLLGSMLATAEVLRRDYLMVAPERLTIDDKGGAQWVALRKIGRELGRRTHSWKHARLFVWGIQSPLYVYSGLAGVTRQVFTDPLIVAFMDGDHPLIAPRLQRTSRELEANPPDLILVGERPFPGLREFLRNGYTPAPLMVNGRDVAMGRLWVRRDRLSAFQEGAR